MTIHTSALLKASGVAIGVATLVAVCGLGVNMAAGIPPGSVPSPGEIPPAYYAMLLPLSCLGYVLPVGYGAAYAWFARRDDAALSMGPAALGGAITGMVAAVYQSIWSSVMMAVSLPGMRQMYTEMGVPAELSGLMMFSVLAGLCVAVVIFSGLGALGGLGYAALTER